MILQLHLCGPKGDGLRLLVDRALAMLQADNEFLIQAMLRGGRTVPDLMEDMDPRPRYQPPTREEIRSGQQVFRGYRQMVGEQRFACGDASSWEAAVLRMKYQEPARAFAISVSDDGLFHAVYRVGGKIIDPVDRFSKQTGTSPRWEIS